ncbi:MAG: hypothetical protein LBT76_01345 [Tannerella sp.]|jgi:hypothetical protein|nr:hypothetical protein [Tannerella sp.]
MTEKQLAKQQMLQKVIRTLDENESLYATIPVFVKTAQDLKNVANAIKMGAESQPIMNLLESTVKRNESETALVNRLIVTASILSLLAVDTDNTALLSKVSLTKSQLYRMPHCEQVFIARRIHAEALAHVETIINYGITANAIYELETVISRYENLLAALDADAVTSKRQAVTLEYLLADSDTLLNDRMDKLMRLFKTSHPNFYAAYFNVRNIVRAVAE